MAVEIPIVSRPRRTASCSPNGRSDPLAALPPFWSASAPRFPGPRTFWCVDNECSIEIALYGRQRRGSGFFMRDQKFESMFLTEIAPRKMIRRNADSEV
jgi:hypothetical protein